jgi:MFS transporter, PPP family, 3-phenylpropionic acid transporter
MVIINKDIKRFRMFMFFYWAMILSVTGMYTMYISHLGFSKKEISIAVTIYTIAGLVGQSYIGYLVDKFRCIKKIIFVSVSMGLAVGIGIIFAKLNWQIYMLLFIWGFFVAGTNSLTDAWCINTLKSYNEQRNFGRVRGFGSIGYGISGAFLGLLLQQFGWRIYQWYIIASIFIILLIIYKMTEKSIVESKKLDEEERSKISLREALREIIKIRPLMGMIAIMFVYSFVMRGIYSYLGVLVGDYGGGALSLGLTYFLDASPEIVTFFLATKLLKRFHSKSLILAAFVLQIIRLSVILIFSNALAVMSMGVLSGFAFGLVAASYKTYIYELAPAKYKASTLSLAESIIGLSAIISAPIFGFVFAQFGTSSAILFGLIINMIAALAMLKNVLSK